MLLVGEQQNIGETVPQSACYIVFYIFLWILFWLYKLKNLKLFEHKLAKDTLKG